MKILAIHSSTSSTLTNDLKSLIRSDRVRFVHATSPSMAVESLSKNGRFDLVVISMGCVWSGNDRWSAVVRACGTRLPCVFIPDTCEIMAITRTVLNNHVVCPLNTSAGRRFFSTFVAGILAESKERAVEDKSRRGLRLQSMSASPGCGTVAPTCASQRTDVDEKQPRLTRRQTQVLGLIVQGKSNRQIATELSVAEGTVKLHSIAIYRELGVSNRVQAVLRAQQLAVGI